MQRISIKLKFRIFLYYEYKTSLSLQNNILTSIVFASLQDWAIYIKAGVWNLSEDLLFKHCLVATLIEEEFREYVKQMMEEQEKEYVKKRNIELKILPDFVNLIKSFNQLSSEQVITHHFRGQWKVSPADKNQQEEEDDKEAKEKKIKEEAEMISQLEGQEKMIKEIIEKIKNLESIEDERNQYSSKLARLYEIGLINKERNPAVEKQTVDCKKRKK